MRKLGYQAVDILVEHLTHLGEKSVTRKASRKHLEEIFREPIPMQGTDPFELLSSVKTEVFENIMHLDHPRFFAFVSSPSNYISILADFLASGFNVFSGTWLEASAPSQIELVTIDWLIEIFGLPKNSAGGLFLSGGSMANLTGLILAKNYIKSDDAIGVVYCSDQTHSSVERGVKILGKEAVMIRKIPSNIDFQLDLKLLERSITEDKKRGLQPLCIVANAGTTNTGAIDDFVSISEICRKEGLWFHVDGAYGGVAIISDSQKRRFKGIEQADSIGIDPHKWFFQPYEIGCLLVRDSRKLKDVFYVLPEYLKDANLSEEQLNYSNYSLQLTRGFKAFKLWLSLKTFGLENFKKAIEWGIELAKMTEAEVLKHSYWEIVTPAQIGIINFRYFQKELEEEKLNNINQQIIDSIVKSGFAMISSTILNKKTVIRLCIINPRTTKQDIESTVDKLNEIAKSVNNA